MMGSAATSLSTMLQTVIDISPPESTLGIYPNSKTVGMFRRFWAAPSLKLLFACRLMIWWIVTIIQLYPIEFARKVVETFFNLPISRRFGKRFRSGTGDEFTGRRLRQEIPKDRRDTIWEVE